MLGVVAPPNKVNLKKTEKKNTKFKQNQGNESIDHIAVYKWVEFKTDDFLKG